MCDISHGNRIINIVLELLRDQCRNEAILRVEPIVELGTDRSFIRCWSSKQ